MGATLDEILQLAAYSGASRELVGWITGAKALALLSCAVECGLIEALGGRRSVSQLTEFTGLPAESISELCLALEAHGVLQREGDIYALAPDYARLNAPTAAIPLASLIRQAMVMAHTLQISASGEVAYTTTNVDDILAMAEGAGISAMSTSPHVGQETIAKVMPEVEALWQAGARHLEVGCGVGNALLGTTITYPKVIAVGIEIEAQTAAEATRRAVALGVSERVEVRHMDACALQDVGAFDTIQWSQFFFPTATRPVVLKAMRRALKPGGYLYMPWFITDSNDQPSSRWEKLRLALRVMRSGGVTFLGYLNDFLGDNQRRRRQERRSAALNRVLFTRWGVPVRSLAELETEVTRSGFKVIREVHLPISQFVLTRGMLLTQRAEA